MDLKSTTLTAPKTTIASYATSSSMMSHAQPKRSSQHLNQPHHHHRRHHLESSLPSSSSRKFFSSLLILNQVEPPPSLAAGAAAAAAATDSGGSRFSFGSKVAELASLPSQAFSPQHPHPACCFIVSSSCWSGRNKLKCSCDVFSMASQQELSSNMPHLEMKKKKLTGQQKREQLEREVATLEKLLKEEEKVHEILEQAHNKDDGSNYSENLPDLLPPKAKELLSELAVVEDEIARLEDEITKLQDGVKQERELTKEIKSKSKQWDHFRHSSPLNRVGPQRMGFETKALHFISKAIKGDYILNDFSLHKSIDHSNTGCDDQKENRDDHKFILHDRSIPRKSGMIKSPSPMRDPRHPSPRPRERNPMTSSELPPKAIPASSIIMEDEQHNYMHPNKLSENILKCLIFIYVRLLRTSRATELERSGTINSRSINFSLSSRSFRADAGINSNLITQKESRQQDPYGVFHMEDSVPRDIGPYKNLVIFTSASMDPKCVSNPSSIPLLRKLRVFLTDLQKVDLRPLNLQQKLAFWINMYNACVMHGFLQHGVPSTPDKLLALMNKATFNIGGNTINAQAIEHYILRNPESSKLKEVEKDDKETIVRGLYGLEFMDPNITFALCCGTRSSPAVKIYTAEGVGAELEKAKLEYLQASIVVTNSKRIAFPELLLRNMLDFAVDVDSLVDWVCQQLPTSGTLRKTMVDCFRSHNSSKIPATVEKITYDYEFQYLLPI